MEQRTGVTDTRVENLNANLMGFGRGNLDILNGKWFAGSPCDSSLILSAIVLENRKPQYPEDMLQTPLPCKLWSII